MALIDQKFAELQEDGFCVLHNHYPKPLLRTVHDAFEPILAEHLRTNRDNPNRGPNHYFPMPFDPPCFAPEFFFDTDVLGMAQSLMDEKIVADQWGCDTPILGSTHQGFHRDYRNPLFPEFPEMKLPPYMLIVSFGLIDITPAHGPIEIAPGTQRIPVDESLRAIEAGAIPHRLVPLEIGDVLVRQPWALHRGTPNTTNMPRPLVTIRYVRRWYADGSRDVNAIPKAVWNSLTADQQRIMRFPVAN